jgi:hypothetical protein
MKDNIFSWFSGFTLSSISMINGWIQVETLFEVAVYGFIGGLAGMLGKWLIQYIKSKFTKPSL